ncbi:MAG TPA: glycosyltransferase family 4 protein [Acidimicrobiales bacterium]|nr:glycosyltransferase family 4 protein [Acidimicrobiales bacterium]
MSAAGPKGPPAAVHQFIPTLNPRDASGTHTLLLRDILRRAGWRSDIFAEAIHDDLASHAFKHWMYPAHAADGDVLIYQFSTSSAVAEFLYERPEPLVLDFHNFTGPEYFAGWEPHTEERAARAADELALLAPRAVLGLADSRFNETALRRAGCTATRVVPVLVDYRRVAGLVDPLVAAELATLKARGGNDILFVGRVVPSKAQHELVKALWAYRRLYDPSARLHLVGGTQSYEYTRALRGFIGDLGLTSGVRLTGELSEAALAAHFAAADVYLSLSAHEGFGVPLIEAMAAGVPVIARAVGAVPETVGDGALLLGSSDAPFVAAALHRACTDDALRAHLVAGGRTRLTAFSLDAVGPQMVDAIATVTPRPQ